MEEDGGDVGRARMMRGEDSGGAGRGRKGRRVVVPDKERMDDAGRRVVVMPVVSGSSIVTHCNLAYVCSQVHLPNSVLHLWLLHSGSCDYITLLVPKSFLS